MKLFVYDMNVIRDEYQLEMGKKYKVGRKDTCDILLEKKPGISREHFEIWCDDSGTWRVNVVSEIMLIEINGEPRKDFALDGKGHFSL